jgi:drug/metabolite transporter (DMT)-like permease
MISSFLLGTFLLKEKVGGQKILAIVLALGGLSFYSNDLIAINLGIIFGVLAGIFDGISNVFRRKLAGVNRNAVIRVQYAVGTIFTGLITLLSGDQILKDVNTRGAVATIIFSIILIAAANLLLYGYQHFDVNIGTVIMSIELVFGALLGFLFYQEVPKSHELLGGTLIFAGSVISSIDLRLINNRTKTT